MDTQVTSKGEKAKRPKPKRPTQYHSKNELAHRYQVVTRTLDRWRVLGLFPEPDLTLPNGAPRWSDELVVAHERAAVGKKGAT
jgi:hypothetical protein